MNNFCFGILKITEAKFRFCRYPYWNLYVSGKKHKCCIYTYQNVHRIIEVFQMSLKTWQSRSSLFSVNTREQSINIFKYAVVEITNIWASEILWVMSNGQRLYTWECLIWFRLWGCNILPTPSLCLKQSPSERPGSEACFFYFWNAQLKRLFSSLLLLVDYFW